MKGNNIELNGKIYTRDMFDKLPAGLTLEYCATRSTPDGIAFQGHSAPLSNFYPRVIHDATTGQVYNSAEQMYAHKTALAHHNKAIAEHILREKNPYTIQQLSKGVTIDEEWKKRSLVVLRDVVKQKLDQNKDLRAKLLLNKKRYFYEASYCTYYGVGKPVSEADNITVECVGKKGKAKNERGKILESLRDDYIRNGTTAD